MRRSPRPCASSMAPKRFLPLGRHRPGGHPTSVSSALWRQRQLSPSSAFLSRLRCLRISRDRRLPLQRQRRIFSRSSNHRQQLPGKPRIDRPAKCLPWKCRGQSFPSNRMRLHRPRSRRSSRKQWAISHLTFRLRPPRQLRPHHLLLQPQHLSGTILPTKRKPQASSSPVPASGRRNPVHRNTGFRRRSGRPIRPMRTPR